MATYGAMAAGEADLKRFSTLDTEDQAEAESFADSRIDTLFGGWDRTGWTLPDDVPPDIARIWAMFAAARYWQVQASATTAVQTNDTTGRRPFGDVLMERAEALAASVIDAGGPINVAGTGRELPEETSRGSMFVDCWR